jgi:hypothetical protein
LLREEVQVKVFPQESACQKQAVHKHALRKRLMSKQPARTAVIPRSGGQRMSRLVNRAVGLCLAAMLLAPGARTAAAQGEHKEARAIPAKLVESPAETAPAVHEHPVSKLAGRYFVDFRARTAASYGHAFVWYGRLNGHGRVGLIDVAGLHPASDSPVPYILGHIMPVPSETGKSYGDLDEQYLTANYRVYLSEADAKQVFAYIKRKQDSSPLWMASLYNCTAFLADIAAYMGLRAPTGSTWMYPEDFINKLRDLNGGRQEVSLAARH